MGWTKNIGESLGRELAVWRVGALPGLLVIALVVAVRLVGGLQFFERFALDYLLRLRFPEPTDERILVVGINEQDIRQLGYPISDQTLATLLQSLERYQPSVIGLDIFRDMPMEPGHAGLVNVFRTNQNIIGIEKILDSQTSLSINPPPALPADQIGFVDAVLDTDGYLRRSLLGATDANEQYKFSLTLRLAERYLATHGVTLTNGIRDPVAMRFGNVELTRFQANTGGYVGADAGGNQILINFRSGAEPFHQVSMQEVLTGQVPADWIRDRVVLVGYTALSVKDTVSSVTASRTNPGLVFGVEIQAHAVSQIVSAVLDGRALLQVWPEGWEYFWIIVWGGIGISLGRFIRSPFKLLLGLGVAVAILISICYGLLLLSWWVPLVPALLVLMLNGTGLTAALFYQHTQDLKARLHDRQLAIDETFDAIHNGPLQTLAQLLRNTQDQALSTEQLHTDLARLNRELRAVYDTVQIETLADGKTFYLNSDLKLNLDHPMHEVLYEVYTHTLSRDLPCFKTLKLKVTTFDEMDERFLRIEQKRGLCRFLEEALCNVGKHAAGVTRLDVVCKQEKNQNVICVIDNGIPDVMPDESQRFVAGRGTQQARELARQLGGTFQRNPVEKLASPSASVQGTVCQLTWSVSKPWFWRF